jgi:hypothetical protein
MHEDACEPGLYLPFWQKEHTVARVAAEYRPAWQMEHVDADADGA